MEWMEGVHAVIGRQDGDIAWWQMSIRGVLIMVYGLVLLRLAGRRAFGELAPLDFIIAILVGSSLSRALTANAPFLPTLAATAAIVGAYIGITRLAVHFRALGWLVKGDVVQLVHDGKIDWGAMRREGISKGDLEEELREKGVRGLGEVTAAHLERSGTISVTPRKG